MITAGLAVLFLTACNPELDIMAPYEENTVVYALLDADSTTQYVRINKAFLGPGNALEYAQVPDSSEYSSTQLEASIEEVVNGTVVNTYPLHDTTWAHDPGVFAGPTHKLYYFNGTLNDDAIYRLQATAKGEEVWAQTPIVAPISPTGAIVSQPLRMVAIGGTYVSQVIRWSSSRNGKRYDVSYRFRWDDVTGTDTVSRSFTRSLGSLVANGLDGGEQLSVQMNGESFFQAIADRAGDNPSVERRIFRGVDILWAVAGPDLHNYLQLNSPISGLVEERPSYTNINPGYGLFSTRRFLVLPVNGLNAQTAPELVEGPYTAALNFCIPGSVNFSCD